jgi:hypothetical protein
MHSHTTLALAISILLATSAAVAQTPPAGMSDTDAILTSTEDWDDADTNDDGTLSYAELSRAEPRLGPYFREIDADADQRITRDEIANWQSGPEPTDIDADELPAGEVDAGEDEPATAPAPAPDEDASRRNRGTDDLLPDDGDKATELLPDDAS